MENVFNSEAAQKALNYLENCYAPYSNFHVAAVLEDMEGDHWKGGNVENSVFGLSLCAERIAVARAINAGVRDFRQLIICTEKEPAPPCGSCRAFLAEFVDDLQIYSLTPEGKKKQFQLSELYPEPFHLDERPDQPRNNQ